MNKRIIRVIIYEGDEELVDAYERHSLQHTQKSHGIPRHFQEPTKDTIDKQIFITGITLEENVGLFQAIDLHNMKVKGYKKEEGIKLEFMGLEEPILNQLNK